MGGSTPDRRARHVERDAADFVAYPVASGPTEGDEFAHGMLVSGDAILIGAQ